jgi:hypothetical protein
MTELSKLMTRARVVLAVLHAILFVGMMFIIGAEIHFQEGWIAAALTLS